MKNLKIGEKVYSTFAVDKNYFDGQHDKQYIYDEFEVLSITPNFGFTIKNIDSDNDMAFVFEKDLNSHYFNDFDLMVEDYIKKINKINPKEYIEIMEILIKLFLIKDKQIILNSVCAKLKDIKSTIFNHQVLIEQNEQYSKEIGLLVKDLK